MEYARIASREPEVRSVALRAHLHEGSLTPPIEELDAALERLALRINARSAGRENLRRCAQGLSTVERGLRANLYGRLEQVSWDSRLRLTETALEAMREQLALALGDQSSLEIEEQRELMKQAVLCGTQACSLLRT